MGFIYCMTSLSGKMYIGQTRQQVCKRIKQHCKSKSCTALSAAIAKYGIESFKVETLLEIDNNMLDMYEKKFIDMLNTMVPNGYNIRSGGSNGYHCEQSRNKMREAKLGESNPNFGKPRSEAAKANISKAKAGSKHHFYGKELTVEHKLALSRAHKKDDLPMYLVRVKPRPHANGGYAVVNHPMLPTKYFTSSKYPDSELYNMAYAYLKSY
jgi:group I intron endonuclease